MIEAADELGIGKGAGQISATIPLGWSYRGIADHKASWHLIISQPAAGHRCEFTETPIA
jgi:hypothetical protein